MSLTQQKGPPILVSNLALASWPRHAIVGDIFDALRKGLRMRKAMLIGLMALQACATPEVRLLHHDEVATAPYHYLGKEQMVGSLMYEGGCLLFTDHDHTKQVLPIWPDGTQFEETLLTFHQPGRADQRVIVGEEIRLDGDDGDWSQLDPERYAPFSHQCGSKPFFVTDVTPAN
jgi:hypothetical protein